MVALSDFHVITEISRSPSAAVFVVRHRRTRQRMVLKTSQMSKSSREYGLRGEGELLRSLSHPSVVTCLGVFHDLARDTLCVMLEDAPHGDLAAWMAKKRSGELCNEDDDIWPLFLTAWCGVDALHCRFHVIHRDIKPSNLLLFSRGNTIVAKVADFGVALKCDNALTASSTELCGTPSYAAPEAVSGKGYGHKNDVWGMGVTLYELACGHRAFRDPTVPLVQQIQAGLPSLAGEASARLSTAVEHLADVDASKRVDTPTASRVLASLVPDLWRVYCSTVTTDSDAPACAAPESARPGMAGQASEQRMAGQASEQRMEGQASEQRMAGPAAHSEQRMEGQASEQRLAGQASEQRLAGPAAHSEQRMEASEQRMAGQASEQRLAGQASEQCAAGQHALDSVVEERGPAHLRARGSFAPAGVVARAHGPQKTLAFKGRSWMLDDGAHHNGEGSAEHAVPSASPEGRLEFMFAREVHHRGEGEPGGAFRAVRRGGVGTDEEGEPRVAWSGASPSGERRAAAQPRAAWVACEELRRRVAQARRGGEDGTGAGGAPAAHADSKKAATQPSEARMGGGARGERTPASVSYVLSFDSPGPGDRAPMVPQRLATGAHHHDEEAASREATHRVERAPALSAKRRRAPSWGGSGEARRRVVAKTRERSGASVEGNPALCGRTEDRPALCGRTEDRPALRGSAEDRPALCGSADDRPALRTSAEDRPALCGRTEDRPALCGRTEDRPALCGSVETTSSDGEENGEADDRRNDASPGHSGRTSYLDMGMRGTASGTPRSAPAERARVEDVRPRREGGATSKEFSRHRTERPPREKWAAEGAAVRARGGNSGRDGRHEGGRGPRGGTTITSRGDGAKAASLNDVGDRHCRADEKENASTSGVLTARAAKGANTEAPKARPKIVVIVSTTSRASESRSRPHKQQAPSLKAWRTMKRKAEKKAEASERRDLAMRRREHSFSVPLLPSKDKKHRVPQHIQIGGTGNQIMTAVDADWWK